MSGRRSGPGGRSLGFWVSEYRVMRSMGRAKRKMIIGVIFSGLGEEVVLNKNNGFKLLY